jgi:hypothetical protein
MTTDPELHDDTDRNTAPDAGEALPAMQGVLVVEATLATCR